jgi:Protein of unknown function (DUF2804)
MSGFFSPIASQLADHRGQPRFGSFEGAFKTIDLHSLKGPFRPSAVQRLFRRKKWLYLMVADAQHLLTCAVVDVGYASNAFFQLVDVPQKAVLVDESRMGMALLSAHVGDSPLDALSARFRGSAFRIEIRRHTALPQLHVTLHGRTKEKRPFDAALTVLLDAKVTPMTVVAPVEAQGLNVTQKVVGLSVAGDFRCGKVTTALVDARAGFDYTQGFLARQTAWRWAFGVGTLATGEVIGFNLVEGFNESLDGVNENAVWLDGRLYPVGRARFEFDAAAVLKAWRVTTTCGTLSLRFEPAALHREHHNFGLVSSTFTQPVGQWHGRFEREGLAIEFVCIPGVAETQQVKW